MRCRTTFETVVLLIATTLAVSLAPLALAGQDPVQDPGSVAAQRDAREQARSVLSSDVFDQIDAEARALEETGIPADILYRKALEGAAKRIPADRFLPGVLGYAGRLREARIALLPELPSPSVADGPLLVAGADALLRGVSPRLLRQLGEDGMERTPVSVLVLGDLVETGIGDDRALALVREAMRARTRDQRMLDLPEEVRRLLRDGRTPSDVTDEMRRVLRRRAGGDRGGTG